MKHSLDKHWYLQLITLLRVEEDKVSAQQTCPIPMLVTAVKLGVEITRPIVARTAERGKKRLFNKCRRKKRATNQGQSGAKLNAHMSSLAEMRICHMSYAFLAPSGALIAIPTYYWYSTHPLFQITPVLNTGLSLSEPLQLYQGQSLDLSADSWIPYGYNRTSLQDSPR